MPEDVTRDLTAFTPVVPDRDAILFAAGQAAARRWAGWKWLTVGLLATNAVTLGVLFWPRPAVNPPSPVETAEPPPADVPPSPPPEPYSYLALWQGRDIPSAEAGGTTALPTQPLTPRSLSDPRFH